MPPPIAPTPTQAALLTLLRQDGADRPVQLATSHDWTAVADLAMRQRVGPLLRHRLTTTGRAAAVPREVLAGLERRHQQSAGLALRFLADARRLTAALVERGVPVVGLKGLTLATEVYDQPGLREMNDLDLLIPESGVETAVAVAHTLGYTPIEDLDLRIARSVYSHLPRLMRDGLGVEVHWRLAPAGSGINIQTPDLLDRAVPWPAVPGARMLAPEDLLLHICLHGALLHGFELGLRPLADVAAILTRHHATMDWVALADRAILWRARRSVLLLLTMAHEHLGAPVPQAAWSALGVEAKETEELDLRSRSALSQVFAMASPAADLSRAASRVLDDGPLWDRMQYLWRRAWLLDERREFAQHRPGRWVLGRYVVTRAWDRIVRFGGRLWQVRRATGSPEADAVAQRNHLDRWLREDC